MAAGEVRGGVGGVGGDDADGLARGDLDVARARVERPQLVDAGHGDHGPVQGVAPGEVPRGGEAVGAGIALAARQRLALHPLLAGAGEGGDLGRGAGAQQAVLPDLHAAQAVPGGVGDQEVVAHLLGDLGGQVFTMFVLTVAAAEAAIGLAILVVFFRNRGTIEVEDVNVMKG